MTAMARENCNVALGEHVMLNPIRGSVQEATKVVVKSISTIDPTESEFVIKTLLTEQLGIILIFKSAKRVSSNG